MKKMKSLLKTILIFVLLVALAWVILGNYSVIFSQQVVGQVTAVERIELPVALMAQQGANSEMPGKAVTFSIGIRDQKTGAIYAANSDDRQWAVAKPGQCVEAKFLPYPPWDINRRGTYLDARLMKLYECP